MKSLIENLEEVKDYRKGNAIDHKLIDILVIAVLGTLCGCEGWKHIEQFGNAKKEWLKTFLELPNGIPSHDTFGRVFSNINPKEFHKAFIDWVNGIREFIDKDIVALD
ncbi:ISAs1 family transposase, partial [Clostridium tepidiprofundi]|uniref:ISAs1 family transposase n=1 Tax=Clostridium tepidiprofundi TaxID=420412 RepID=UPI000B1AB162